MCNKDNIPWWFQIKHDKNNIFVVDQYTIAANETKQVYLAIQYTRTAIKAPLYNIDCRTLKRKK